MVKYLQIIGRMRGQRGRRARTLYPERIVIIKKRHKFSYAKFEIIHFAQKAYDKGLRQQKNIKQYIIVNYFGCRVFVDILYQV